MTQMISVNRFFYSLLVLTLLSWLHAGCDDPVEIPPTEGEYSGTGVFTYTDYPPLSDKPIRVFYHVPDSISPQSPVLFVFHGADRNAAAYRNAWIEYADQYGIMVFAPEFNTTHYPGGDMYNLGNVFVDGDNPSPATLNEESSWTFSLIEPLFQHIRLAMQSNRQTYDVYGHSAGGQFAHRLLMLKPDNSLGRVIASASGWYTVPDGAIDFPYGIGQSPIASFDLGELFAHDLIIMVGEEDNDPNSAGLRHNAQADQQGLHRVERAMHFYSRGQEIAARSGSNFRWRYLSLPRIGHAFQPTAAAAAELLYE
jgi:pimeloyl-ACP methyl ester carboxylesterase